MKTKQLSVWAGVAVLGWLLACVAQADIIKSYEHMVTVGNPENAADNNGYGAVAYEYGISKFEVTAGEWRDFLNKVDPTGTNALGLYDPRMASDPKGCQITLVPSNPDGSKYDFSGRPEGDESHWVNRPVNFVSWFDAARYTNWLTTRDTERGVYEMKGLTSVGTILPHVTAAVTLGVPIAYFIPTEDEWYKAAYFDPNKIGSGLPDYWHYPMRSDLEPKPSNQLVDPDPGNNATFYHDHNFTIVNPYWRTEVGAHKNSGSAHGTFDQGGNVWEWTENHITRGGMFDKSDSPLTSGMYLLERTTRGSGDPANKTHVGGFRIGSRIPEPGSLVLLLLGAAELLARRR